MKRLNLYAYPGNIRELRNILERARLFADDGLIRAEHLPTELGSVLGPMPSMSRRSKDNLGQLAQALDSFNGSRSELARHLGMSERTLYRRLRELGL
ncbi:Nitrogen fixation protein VnfA [compost metagenome]